MEGVLNPANTVYAIHLHVTQERYMTVINYEERSYLLGSGNCVKEGLNSSWQQFTFLFQNKETSTSGRSEHHQTTTPRQRKFYR